MTKPHADVTPYFDDGLTYDRFMGRWSSLAGAVFLDWLDAPAHAHWLDVGCGTGSLATLIADTRSPAAVFAIDPAPAQISYASRQPVAQYVNFGLGDARKLAFADSSFDVVVSALALNFIPGVQQALSEMRRVTKPGGIAGGYVWDFAAERSPSGPLRKTMRRLGLEPPRVPGANVTALARLHRAFACAGFDAVVTRLIDVTIRFVDFDHFWTAQTASYGPMANTVSAMTPNARAALIETLKRVLPALPDGTIEYRARANAVKASMPLRLSSN